MDEKTIKWFQERANEPQDLGGCNSFLVYGNMGSGKTYLLRTCKQPVVIHSFDPDGSVTLRKFVDGRHFILQRFEGDNPDSPTAFSEWEKAYDEMDKNNVFEQIGTYCIDSLTTWADALMARLVWQNRSKRQEGIPAIQDYMVQQNVLTGCIRHMNGKPCDKVLTGHIGLEKDEVTGRMVSSLFVSGKLSIKIPLLFSEVYVMQAVSKVNGPTEYRLLTQRDDLYVARTRIGGDGVLEKFEEPDIKKMLAKAGLPANDKEALG